MKTTSNFILDLVASMERARARTRTDSELEQIKTGATLLDELHDLCLQFHALDSEEIQNGKKLSTTEILEIIATLAAYYILEYGNGDVGKFGAIANVTHQISTIVFNPELRKILKPKKDSP